MDIRVEFLQQLEISLSQFLLMPKRHHLPVGLVGIVDCSLSTQIGGVTLHVLVDVGHLVEGDDASAHEHRLYEHHRTSEEVTCVSTQGIDDILAYPVKLTSKLLKPLFCHL